MKVNVKLFAVVAEKLGRRELELELPEGATVAEALTVLTERFPEMEDWRQPVSTAINMSYVPGSERLHDGDELALIPPVSGG